MAERLFPDVHIAPPVAPTIDPDRLPYIHRLLLGFYGQPLARVSWDPLTQFVYSLLSSRTKDQQSQQVMRDLRARFGPSEAGPVASDWEAVRDAPVEEIERTVAAVTFPEVKAPRLKAALVVITARYGSLTLDFLAKYRTEKIRAWLESFEGVGPQISAAVVNFSTLRRRAICVDGHHLRVTQRLGLTPRGDARRTEDLLMRLVPETWTAEMLDEHHSLIKVHGQTLCTFAEPRCAECPFLKLCPYGQRQTGAGVGSG